MPTPNKKPIKKCYNRIMKKTGELANKYESLLTKAEQLYLTNISFSISNFYGLPKVHKSKQINEAIQQENNEYIKLQKPVDLTLRPIVGRSNCLTRLFSQPIDNFKTFFN